jgi:hypothetical protein
MNTPPRESDAVDATIEAATQRILKSFAAARGAGGRFVDVTRDRRIPVAAVRHVDANLVVSGICILRCVSTHEPISRSRVKQLTPLPVAMTAWSAAVDGVAGGDLLAAWPNGSSVLMPSGALQTPRNGADRDVDVDNRRAVHGSNSSMYSPIG